MRLYWKIKIYVKALKKLGNPRRTQAERKPENSVHRLLHRWRDRFLRRNAHSCQQNFNGILYQTATLNAEADGTLSGCLPGRRTKTRLWVLLSDQQQFREPGKRAITKIKSRGAVSRLTCCSGIAIKETQNVISNTTCKNGIKQPAVA